MADPSPSAHTPMSQWLRPGNVAFVVGGIVGIVALASDLPSRAVKGLGIASAAVSMLFGVYDRTKTERLTWPALWVMLWKPCRSELSVMASDARRAYRFAMRDILVGPLHSSRTFYLEVFGIRPAGDSVPLILADSNGRDRLIGAYFGPWCAQLVAVFSYTLERLPPDEGTVTGILSGSIVLLLEFPRCCYFAGAWTLYCISQEAYDWAAQVLRTVQSSERIVAWRCRVPDCFLVILTIIGLAIAAGIDFDKDLAFRWLATPSVLFMPAPLGFLIVVVIWLVSFIQITLVRIWYPNAGVSSPDLSTVV